MEIRGWQAYPDEYAFLLHTDAGGVVPSLTVESLRIAYDRYLESAVTILEGDGEYEAKYAQVRQLMDRVVERAKTDSDTAIMIRAMQWWEAYYQQHVLYESFNKAVEAAIEVYLVRAKTGQMPQHLPEGLPKDPFSGEAFEYLLMDTGFTLRCRVAPIDHEVKGERLKIRQYEFKLAE